MKFALLKLRRLVLASVALVVASTAGCKEPAPPINAERLFTLTEKAVRDHYYFPEGQGWTMDALYAAAFTAARGSSSGASNRASMVAWLNSLPEEERRARTLTAVAAMIGALPRGYNAAIPPESLAWERDPNRKAGAGIVLHMVAPGRILAVDALEGSAAYRNSVAIGQFIKSVDGVSVAGMDVQEVAGRIRGPAGESVKIEFEDGKSYDLERGEVTFRNILNSTWSLPDGGKVEYIMLRSTLGDTVGQVRGLLARIGKREAIVLDLRRMFNGDFEKCYGLANLFVNSGRLGGLQYRDQQEVEFVADVDRVFEGKVYVVLGDLASPFAETFAAALSGAPNVSIAGASGRGQAFLSHVETVEGDVTLSLTAGVALGRDGKPLFETGVPADLPTRAPLPEQSPVDAPNAKDPVQVALARELGIPLD